MKKKNWNIWIGKSLSDLEIIYWLDDTKTTSKSKVICECKICGSLFCTRLEDIIREKTNRCSRCAHKIIGLAKQKPIAVGSRIGSLVVVKYNPGFSKCKCDCGNETNVKNYYLNIGKVQRCDKCRLINFSNQAKTNTKTIEPNTRFGKLVVVKPGEPIVGYMGYNNSTSICRCDCGNICCKRNTDLIEGNVKSCGCLISYGEELCRKYFNANGIDFSTQYTFADLIGEFGRCLRFDFALFNNHNLIALIEYQGEQHYINGDYGRYQREVTDPLKKEYCCKNKIPLFEIKYNQNIENRMAEILKLIKERSDDLW